MRFHLNVRDPKQDAVYRERVNEERRKYREKRHGGSKREEPSKSAEVPVVMEVLRIAVEPLSDGALGLLISGKDESGDVIGVGAVLEREHVEALQRLGEVGA